MARLNRENVRIQFLSLCSKHGLGDEQRHALIEAVTGGRTSSVARTKRGERVATAHEILQAVERVQTMYGEVDTMPEPPNSRHGDSAGDWVDLPVCPLRDGTATAATAKKILAMARAKLGLDWQGRLFGLVFKDYPQNPVALFHRRRAREAAPGIGHQLAELPEAEAIKIVQMLKYRDFGKAQARKAAKPAEVGA